MIVLEMLKILLDVDIHLKSKFFRRTTCQSCAVRHRTPTDKKCRQALWEEFPAMQTLQRHISVAKYHLNVQSGIMLRLINLDSMLDSLIQLRDQRTWFRNF